jgi:hypothetical protein
MGNTPPGRHLHTATGDIDQQPDNDVTALHEFASSIETSFLEIGQSLTDPSTAAAFTRTLDVWQRLLEGSHAQGVIDDQQLTQLLETLHGMRQAPTLL